MSWNWALTGFLLIPWPLRNTVLLLTHVCFKPQLLPDLKYPQKCITTKLSPVQTGLFTCFTIASAFKTKTTILHQLISRHWIICDEQGPIEEVKGPWCCWFTTQNKSRTNFWIWKRLSTENTHRQHEGLLSNARRKRRIFEIEIPEFYLIAPMALH